MMNQIETTEHPIRKQSELSLPGRLICLTTLSILLVVAISGRLLPRSMRPFTSVTSESDNVWQEACKVRDMIMGYSCMY